MTSKTDFSDWFHGEVEDLRRTRDELRVQAHLAKAELRDLWEKLEERFEDLEQRAKRTARASQEPRRQLEEDARKLVGDLREGYRRIRDAI